MKEKFKIFIAHVDTYAFTSAVLMLALGILFVAFPEGMFQTLSYISGSFIMLWGVLRLVFRLREEGGASIYDVIICAAVVIVGVMLIVAPSYISEFIGVFLGVIFVIDSVIKICESRELYRHNRRAGWLSAAIIGAVCGIAGIVIIVNPFASMRIFMIFVGISLLLDSVCGLVLCIRPAVRAVKRARDRENDSPDNDNIIDI